MPSFHFLCFLAFLGLLVQCAGWTHAQEDEPIDERYRAIVSPFLQKHCQECHGPADVQANFRIDESIPNRFEDASVRARWADVVDVLNSHEMPPEERPTPDAESIAQVVDWVTQQIVQAEMKLRENAVVLRRLNRSEYKNTIRDLTGVDFDVSGFPQDPYAGGFDNVGSSLSMSPMQMELYLEAARQIIDAAILDPDGDTQPTAVRWRFEIDSGSSDSNRVRIDGQNPIVNGGNNPVENGFKVLHHASWDKNLNVRDFALKHPGTYIIRFRAAGVIPSRDEVIRSATAILDHRLEQQMRDNPKGEKWHREQRERDIAHFKTDWIYNYGPPRVKVIQDLGGQPKTIAELDVPAPVSQPQVFEIRSDFTTQRAGVTLDYAYSIPSVLENFWMQNNDAFARPTLLVDWIEIEGPVFAQWPPKSHQMLMPQRLTAENEKELAENWIGRFARRAFRRPVSRSDVAPFQQLYSESRKKGATPTEAYKSALTAILVSPSFLFMTETTQANAESVLSPSSPISEYELATRLAYFLWSSMPDSELLQLADQSKLRKSETLRTQVSRMLADPKSEAFIHNFTEQWLGLRELGNNPPATDLYPHYDRHLETSMREESLALFRTILKEDRNVLDFVDADYVVINERLARFYEIDGVRGDDFRVVPVRPQHHRGGLLTQAAMLCTTSNGTRTSPVKRGTWVLKNVLGTDPGLPVANAGDIAPKVPGIDKATVRQRLEVHRQLAQCARCHNKIDPLGLALENYNASGQYREQEGFGYKGRIEANDPRIDASSKLPDGTLIDGPGELKKALREKEGLFLKCLAEKLLTYSIGRELTLADQPAVQLIVSDAKKNDYRLEAMIQAIVQSSAFQQY
jgi:mono/diheme cytochrome c family protein